MNASAAVTAVVPGSQIKFALVNPDKVFSALTKEGITIPEKSDLRTRVFFLAQHYEREAAKTPATELLQCDSCQGDSPSTLTACPYCGDSASETKKAVDPVVTTTPAATPATDEAKPPVASPKEAHVTTTQTATNGKGQALTKVTPKKKGTEEISKYTEADLDKAVKHIASLKANVAGSYWDLGQYLKESVFENNLWKQRKNEDGKPKYSGFDQFVRAECGFTSPVAYDLMDVSKKFTKTEVLTWGHSKLALALKAPDDAIPAVVDKIKGGASHREVAATVKDERKKAGTKRKETGRKKTPAGEKTTAKPPRQKAKAPEAEGRKTITVASIEGRKTIKLFCKDDKEKPAQKINDLPWGSLEMANDVTMFFSVQLRPGGLVIVTDTRRNK